MILNFTQHQATPEQSAQGVADLRPEDHRTLCSLLTFQELPTMADVRRRAGEIVCLYETIIESIPGVDLEAATTDSWPAVMIGGAPFLMGELEAELVHIGVRVLYAFSRRESVDELQADGSVIKRAIFRHVGFVEVDH